MNRVTRFVETEYLVYLCDIIDAGIEYRRLMDELFRTPFRYSVILDRNRIEDAMQLRFDFSQDRDCNILGHLDGVVSVLEVLVALAKRCEDTIMYDEELGDRTSEWFWVMMRNLGLATMLNENFDKEKVDKIVDIFLDRKYSKHGKGGPFYVKNTKEDLAKVDIWMQMRYWINENFV